MFPPSRTFLSARPASPPKWPRSGCLDPSAIPAAPYRTCFRSCPENSAASTCPRCCRPSLRRPAVVRWASSPARSPLACNLAARRGYSRTWLWDSARLPLPHTCSSGRTATDRIPLRTDLSIVSVNARTTLAYVPTPDPGIGTAGPFLLPQNLAPTIRPSRSDRTTADAPETRCPDQSADSPPTVPAPVPRLRFPVPPVTSRPRTDPVATAAIARTPTSSCHTAALAPASSG